MKKIKLNLNQRKAISESINNISVSIIVLGILTPFFSNTINSLSTINITISALASIPLVIFSNYLLS